MNQLSQLISLVSNLTNRLNQIESGSKRIFELPETTPNGLSKIPLSRTIVGGEVSEYITMNAMLQYFIQEIQNIEDSTKLLQMLPPELLSEPRRVRIPVEDEEENPFPIRWKVEGVNFEIDEEVIHEIPDAEEDKYRKDLILADGNGQTLRLAGTESTEGIIEPVVPEGHVLLTTVTVFGDSTYENPTTPILGSQYISKASEGWTNVILTAPPGENSYWYISENSRKLNITGSPNNAVFAGFHASGGSVSQLYDGCTLYVKNSRNVAQLLRHDASEAAVKLWFFTGQDYWLPPNCVAFFLFNFVSMRYECVQVMSADMTYFDDTTTQLGKTNVQGAIEKIVDKISVLDEVANINLFIQYTESTVSGTAGTNLIQPDLGLPILEVEDLQTDSSYSGELVLNIENNNTATAKLIELFGAEIYNNTNPSTGITAKITFTLDFFNQVGDDVDYKLSWEYLSSGEILFGEHTGTIGNTSDIDFELLVTGHSTDSFNLKKSRLWRN